MPNHMYNKCVVQNASDDDMLEIRKLLGSHLSNGEDVAVDFNKLDKMPEDLKDAPEPAYGEEQEKRAEKLKKLYGHKSWYGWSVEHWGTKWNCWDSSIKGNEIRFTTAWAEARPIFCKLSKKFPHLQFKWSWINEFDEEGGKAYFAKGKVVWWQDDGEERIYASDVKKEIARKMASREVLLKVKNTKTGEKAIIKVPFSDMQNMCEEVYMKYFGEFCEDIEDLDILAYKIVEEED